MYNIQPLRSECRWMILRPLDSHDAEVAAWLNGP
jgi:hypothetical protein